MRGEQHESNVAAMAAMAAMVATLGKQHSVRCFLVRQTKTIEHI